MPKSASSFCYQLVLDVLKKYSEHYGMKMANVQDVLPGYQFSGFFDPSDGLSLDRFIEKALEVSRQGKCIGVKLHCNPTKYTKSLIEAKVIFANASFRHPADCILSYMDAHRKEVEEKNQVRFEAGETYQTTLQTIKNQGNIFLEWAKIGQIVVIYFDNLAKSPQDFINRVGHQIGINVNAEALLQSYLNKKEKIWEFNKGMIDRRFLELLPEQIAKVEAECQELVGYIGNYKKRQI
jgi:hypothetical protein